MVIYETCVDCGAERDLFSMEKRRPRRVRKCFPPYGPRAGYHCPWHLTEAGRTPDPRIA